MKNFQDTIREVLADGLAQVEAERRAHAAFRAAWPAKQQMIVAVLRATKAVIQEGGIGKAGVQDQPDHAELLFVINSDPREQEFRLTFKANFKARAIECSALPESLLSGAPAASLKVDLQEASEDWMERLTAGSLEQALQQLRERAI